MIDPIDRKNFDEAPETEQGQELIETSAQEPAAAEYNDISSGVEPMESTGSTRSEPTEPAAPVQPDAGYHAEYGQAYQQPYSYGAPSPYGQSGGYQGQGYQPGGYQAPQQQPYQPPYTQPSQTVWQGSTYHSGPVYSNPAPQKPKKEKKPKKAWGRGKKIAAGAVACLLCCAVVSTASIAGFTALVNNGTIQLNTNSGGNAGTANNPVTINRLVNGDGTPASPSDTNMSMSEIAKKLIPSVVCIQNYQYTQGSQIPFGGAQGNASLKEAGEGSGIILTADGYIATNAHVIADADALKVVLSDGTTYEAKLIGTDVVSDLAVIKVEATGLSAAEFGDSDNLQVAETVMAIGNPGGLEFNSSVTVGYVSALNRSVTNSDGYTIDYIQTDAAINPGNSGGALVNMAGQIVGINTAKITDTAFEGLGFAIPSNTAQEVINDLIQHGSVQNRAALGITGRYIDTMTARLNNVSTGWYVYTVTNESAQKAGLTQGCIITEIEGTAVAAENTIKSLLAKKKPGDSVELTVLNTLAGKQFTATVTLVSASASSNGSLDGSEDGSQGGTQGGSSDDSQERDNIPNANKGENEIF